MLFMGSGEHSEAGCYRLHKALGEALEILSGMQQPPRGKVWSGEEKMNAWGEVEIKKKLVEIAGAFDHKLVGCPPQHNEEIIKFAKEYSLCGSVTVDMPGAAIRGRLHRVLEEAMKQQPVKRGSRLLIWEALLEIVGAFDYELAGPTPRYTWEMIKGAVERSACGMTDVLLDAMKRELEEAE